MSQPVKLSDALVLDARIAGEAQVRSIAGQVEFWAKLGRSVETLLEGQQMLALCRNSGARPLSELMASVDAPAGRERVAAFLDSQPFPHYLAHPDEPGVLIRVEENGKRTVGRFVNRAFVAVKAGRAAMREPARRHEPAVVGQGHKVKAGASAAVSFRSKAKAKPQAKELEA
jgi:hypothetical protein